jgi:UDPglucose 6-dehydrogenase
MWGATRFRYYSQMKIAVVGLGKLGLPLAALLANSDNQVTGYDISEDLRESLVSKKFVSNEPDLMQLLQSAKDNFRISNTMAEAITACEAVFIIVPTPSDFSGRFSNTYLISSLKEIGGALRLKDTPTVVDIVSTVMPGSCDNELRKVLEESSGKDLGDEIGLCYNPEFIALGSVIKDMSEPDMHLIGQSNEWAGDVIEKALNTIIKRPVPCRRMSLIEAELVKISVNNFVTMKISFANSLMQIANQLGSLDIDTILNAIGLDTRIGSRYLKAAMPYGGPCFPRDTRAFTALSSDLSLRSPLARATEEMNDSHLGFLADIVETKANRQETIGIIGLSYKIGTPVMDESPSVNLARELGSRGYKVITWDDEGAVFEDTNLQISSVASFPDLIESVDLLVVGRPHSNWPEMQTKITNSGKECIDFWRQ